ncbi:hypothetical protein RvY_13375 [Ramazzottius varieornatus]|uniref:Uncharacterized protein n=1 Tax=Ramazzottius varieornatus TaxID=947166 RepID=A0A1D1VRP4_RAMVA|nr:hypothetical protein RvY_13375 [Ramazzottius varieornatus]
MDSDTTALRLKLTREEETYDRLLAVDDINPFQYLPGKACTLACKLRVLAERNVQEFKEKHSQRPRESGDKKDPVNIVNQVIQFFAEKKANQPSAVPKADQRSPGAVNRDESLIRGISTGKKAIAPLCSVGDKDTSDGAEEHAQDVRPKLGKTLLRQVNNPATVVRA